MAMPNKKAWLAVLFIVACLAIPFGITYYVSTETFKQRYAKWQGTRPQAPEGATLEGSRIFDGQVMLVKGERIRVHNTSLIFQGIDKDHVVVDLFLEELDHDRAYPQRFPKNIPDTRVIRLGEVGYTLKSVSKNTLVLNILHTPEIK
ncbi:MAG: hypothetical protein MI802_26505 [Desulfobacterales bacterium]|nr:hypothetical protein [Desulfobacterales bacterium]